MYHIQKYYAWLRFNITISFGVKVGLWRTIPVMMISFITGMITQILIKDSITH